MVCEVVCPWSVRLSVVREAGCLSVSAVCEAGCLLVVCEVVCPWFVRLLRGP